MSSDQITSDTSSSGSSTAGSSACCGGAVSRINVAEAEALAARLAAAADPTRLQMLSILAEAPGGEVCACDFVGPTEKSQPTVSHHLKVLVEAGLLEGERRGRWIWYRFSPGGLDGMIRSLLDATS